MPTSLLDQVGYVVNLVEQIPAAERRTVLEVGPGCGTYGVLLRGYLNDPPDRIDAVEVWRPYVDRFNLRGIYGRVWRADVTDAVWRDLGGTTGVLRAGEGGNFSGPKLLAEYDVVVMGDVIEHIEKPAALDLLDRIPGRVVICTPVDDVPCSGEGYENPAEAHVSHWTMRDWHRQGHKRIVETCFERNAGWLVRLGRLPFGQLP